MTCQETVGASSYGSCNFKELRVSMDHSEHRRERKANKQESVEQDLDEFTREADLIFSHMIGLGKESFKEVLESGLYLEASPTNFLALL